MHSGELRCSERMNEYVYARWSCRSRQGHDHLLVREVHRDPFSFLFRNVATFRPGISTTSGDVFLDVLVIVRSCRQQLSLLSFMLVITY
mmetsp:Transcript_15395/g.23857  ORF Transcript_15395/g.23857 Transcript_15395/m.23857 type:complete len:89 (-) Transcript_15395:112-378(-)